METVTPAKNNHYGITSLDESMLSDLIPTRTYGGGTIVNPSDWLTIWRTASTKSLKGTLMGFYLDDARLEPLFARPAFYALGFLRDGVASVCEPDFSMWSDMSLAEQLESVKRKRSVARQWQEYGLRLIPDLNWATEESFKFAFSGIPIGAPIVSCECRTAGGNDDDRRAFLAGLTEGLKQVEPQHVCIYGGTKHSYWLKDRLPAGPTYTLLESWADARGKIRAMEKREARDRNQLQLFNGGTSWAEEAQVEAA